MDENSTAADWTWLKERLMREGPHAPPLVTSSFRPFENEAEPWTTTRGLAELEQVSRRLFGARGSARVVVVTDVEASPEARVFTAVILARLLAEHGRGCILVDTDLRDVGLARHLPHDMDEAEGFVDVVQYGVSVPASLRATPVRGVSVLGVGSWRPDGSDVFADEDLRRLVTQLRATDAAVLVLAPARMPNGRPHPLLQHVDEVVIALGPRRPDTSEVEALLDYIRNRDVPIGAVVTYVGDRSVDLAVDLALVEQEGPGPRPTSPPIETPPLELAPEAHGRASQAKLTPENQPTVRDPDRSSSVFRWSLGVLALLIVVFVVWFLSTRVESEPEAPGAASPERPAEQRPGAEGSAARSAFGGTGEDAESGPSSGAATDASPEEEARDGDRGAESPDETEGSGGSEEIEQESSPQTLRQSFTPTQGTGGDRSAESRASVATASRSPERRSVGAQSHTSPLAAGLQRPVGSGYALHPWSLVDSLEAEAAAATLRAAGMGVAVQGAMIRGRRWYRVLVGSYDTRAQAIEARALLAERRDVDYVGVVSMR